MGIRSKLLLGLCLLALAGTGVAADNCARVTKTAEKYQNAADKLFNKLVSIRDKRAEAVQKSEDRCTNKKSSIALREQAKRTKCQERFGSSIAKCITDPLKCIGYGAKLAACELAANNYANKAIQIADSTKSAQITSINKRYGRAYTTGYAKWARAQPRVAPAWATAVTTCPAGTVVVPPDPGAPPPLM